MVMVDVMVVMKGHRSRFATTRLAGILQNRRRRRRSCLSKRPRMAIVAHAWFMFDAGRGNEIEDAGRTLFRVTRNARSMRLTMGGRRGGREVMVPALQVRRADAASGMDGNMIFAGTGRQRFRVGGSKSAVARLCLRAFDRKQHAGGDIRTRRSFHFTHLWHVGIGAARGEV